MDDIIQRKRQLKKLRNRLEALRNKSGNLRRNVLVNMARSLGRKPSDRGKEPTFVNPLLPHRVPISIPSHPGALARYTAEGIIDQLEQDLSAFEEELEAEILRRKQNDG
jgi:hypothetical protein